MDLWTEYEGKTVAEAYYLETLLRSEGRSAFFRIRDADGRNPVLRLTEAHFDQEEMLNRWQQVTAVGQDNLIEIRRFGQTSLDGVALTYALLEPSDGSLADVLAERPLTTVETLQVARALVAAVSALHRNGLVHQHIEPANVLAVEETVKLRSDCVQPCVVDMEFATAEHCAELRRKDIHDVGMLLLQCLTLGKEWRPTLALAAPFNQLIPGAIDGGWSLERMEMVLDPPKRPLAVSPVTATVAAIAAVPQESISATPDESRARLVPDTVLQTASTKEPAVPLRPRHDAGMAKADERIVPPWVVLVAAMLLVVLIGWVFFGRSSKPAAVKTPAPVAAVANPDRGTVTPVAAKPAASAAVVAPPAMQRAGWHVVAYTYNHEDQAAAKVKQLRRNHVSLQPQVFSPSGRAPFFVALGGSMSRDEAESVLRHARQSGLARDTFARNF